MTGTKLNIGASESKRAASGYICESGARAKALPQAVPFVCKVSAKARAAATIAAAVRRYQLETLCNSLAHAAVYGTIKKLTANSGLVKDGKRIAQDWSKRVSNGYTDANSRLYSLRSDLCRYDGLNGRKQPLTYWEKVERLTERAAVNESAAAELTEQAKAYSAAAQAAKQAQNMEKYNALRTLRNDARTAAAQHSKAAQADNAALRGLLADPMGEGVELFQIAYAYYWERLAVDGLTVNSLCEGYASNGRRSVRTVSAWGFIMVRRAIRENAAARTECAAGYAYFTTEEADGETIESEAYRKIVRSPKYYDTTPTLDETPTAENIGRLSDLVSALSLSEQQLRILKLRLQGKSLAEIADILHVAKGSVSKQTVRIRAAAMQYFPAEMIEKYIK